ncbi:MAG TPA: hypothetical protein VFM06_09580, partial [Candidatus Limnocylindria bacterium]|nr:hypothetical protein [Candidatus Limnocylindria bacterium]
MSKLRVQKSRDEFEGEIYTSTVIVEGNDLPASRADGPSDEIGRARPRVDGRHRVTGSAKYTHDIQLVGMLHC